MLREIEIVGELNAFSPSPAPRGTAGEGGERSEAGEGLAAAAPSPLRALKFW